MHTSANALWQYDVIFSYILYAWNLFLQLHFSWFKIKFKERILDKVTMFPSQLQESERIRFFSKRIKKKSDLFLQQQEVTRLSLLTTAFHIIQICIKIKIRCQWICKDTSSIKYKRFGRVQNPLLCLKYIVNPHTRNMDEQKERSCLFFWCLFAATFSKQRRTQKKKMKIYTYPTKTKMCELVKMSPWPFQGSLSRWSESVQWCLSFPEVYLQLHFVNNKFRAK